MNNFERQFEKDKKKHERFLDSYSWIVGYDTGIRQILNILKNEKRRRKRK